MILKFMNSLEVENEIKMRFKSLQLQAQQLSRHPPRMPPFEYVGMYAGPTKPKPFQRKRANLSTRPQGKLPSLTTMRTLAVSSHQGSGKPVPGNESLRITLALENIHRGTQTFRLKSLQGVEGVPSSGATLVMDYENIKLISNGTQVWEKKWDELDDYEVVDRMHHGDPNNGVKFFFPIPDKTEQELEIFCVVNEVRLLMYAVEFFYNRKLEANGEPAKRQTTHGRRVLKMHTLSGEIDAPPIPKGDLTIRDVEGAVVRMENSGIQGAMSMISSSAMDRRASGGKVTRRSSVTKMFGSPQANQGPLPENPIASHHWNLVCIHQGWLLKKGGMSKNWMKRYAVLYRTAQGHFLSYYSDYSESPLYSSSAEERNIIDLSKTTFIRPVSNYPGGAPPHAFDVCTIEREWTLCPINHDDQQLWLQILTRVIDEDVAVVPDDHMNFVVKARQDPTRQLVLDEYTTCMKVSAAGVSVTTQQGSSNGEFTEKFFWCYTDFFKWSLIHHKNKMALQISVFMSAEFDAKHRQEFLFRTREAQRLASAIEFYIEKFMSIMHLWLEGEEEDTSMTNGSSGSATPESSMNLDTNAQDYEKEPDQLLDLLGDDDDDSKGRGAIGSTDSLDLMAELSLGTNPATPPPPPPPATEEASLKVPPTPETPTVDLFGNVTSPHGEAIAPPPAVPPAASSAGDGLLDLMSGNDDFFSSSGAPTASNTPIGIDVKTKEHMTAWFKLLTVDTNGLLFENDLIALYLKQEYRGSQARIDFMLKSKGQAMQSISADINTAEIGPNALRIRLQSVQPFLEANGQLTARMMVECMTPFSGSPAFDFKFSLGGSNYAYIIPIPSIVTKFVEPVQMNGQDLMLRWNGMNAAGLEVMEIFQAKNPINTTRMPGLVAAATKMAIAQDLLQSSPNIIMAAGTLKTGTPVQNNPGSKITVGCLIKLEMNANAQAYRLTVRTAIPTVSQHVFTTIKKLLT